MHGWPPILPGSIVMRSKRSMSGSPGTVMGVAVGSCPIQAYSANDTSETTLIATWNGTKWSLTPNPSP
jgi:hypothetical protein